MAKRQYDSSQRSYAAREQLHRARYDGLRRLMVDFQRDLKWLDARMADGSSVEDARANLERIESERQELRARTEFRPLPDGEAWRPAGTANGARHGSEQVAGALALMGRRDLVREYCRANAVDERRITFTSIHHGLNRLIGANVPNGYDLHRVILEGSTERFWEGVPAAFPSGSFGPAVRDAATVLLDHDWGERGRLWRAATRLIETRNTQNTRVFVASSGGVSLESFADAGEPATSDPDFQDWPYVDLKYQSPDPDRGEKFFPTFERLLNGGLEQIGSWLAGVVAGWNDDFDQLAVTALAGAPEDDGAGFDAAHLASAISALNRQTINGRTLGSARAILLCGEDRRGIVGAMVPGAARSAGDDTRVVSAVEYSSAVDPNTMIVIHPRCRPLAVGHIGGLEPRVDFGQLNDGPDGSAATGVLLRLTATDPALIQTDADPRVGVGAVRLTE